MNTKLQAIKSTTAFVRMSMNENITYLRALKKTEVTEINLNVITAKRKQSAVKTHIYC